MTTATMERRPINILPLLVILAFVGLALVVVDTTRSHAEQRHGQDGIAVRNCIDSGNIHSTWWNPRTGNYIQVCNLNGDDHTWGIRVLRRAGKGWEEITAFIRRQAASWGEMEDYLIDSGAVLTWIATAK